MCGERRERDQKIKGIEREREEKKKRERRGNFSSFTIIIYLVIMQKSRPWKRKAPFCV
jgi:hypothetical protein